MADFGISRVVGRLISNAISPVAEDTFDVVFQYLTDAVKRSLGINVAFDKVRGIAFSKWVIKYSSSVKKVSNINLQYSHGSVEKLSGHAPKRVIFRYRGVRCIYSEHLKEPRHHDFTSGEGRKQRTLFVFSKDRDIVEALLREFENDLLKKEVNGYMADTTIGGDTRTYGGNVISTWKFTPARRYTLDEIPIHSEVRKRIDTHLKFLRDAWDNGDLTPSRGLLLSGEPGTGKTSIAEAMAFDLHTRLYAMKVEGAESEFWNFVADTYPRRTFLFDDADASPALHNRVVEDEAPTPGAKRKISARSSSTGDRRVVTLDTFNAFMSGARSPKGSLIIIASNYPWVFDPSLYREGRIKEEIKVGYVDSAGIVAWLKHKFAIYNLMDSYWESLSFPDRPANQIFSLAEDTPQSDLTGLVGKLMYSPVKPARTIEDEQALMKVSRETVVAAPDDDDDEEEGKPRKSVRRKSKKVSSV